MRQTSSAAFPIGRRAESLPASARLRLRCARLALALVAGLAAVTFVIALPARWATLRGSSPPGLGLSAGAYGAYSIGLEVLVAVAFFIVGGLIFTRRSSEPIALLAALMLVTFGVSIQSTTAPFMHAHPAWTVPDQLLSFLAITSFLTLFFLFPDGHFVPNWARPVAIAFILCEIPYSLFPHTPLAGMALPGALPTIMWLGWLLTCVAVQIYRYRRVSTPAQRRQTKWLVYGWTMSLMLLLALDSVNRFLPARDAAFMVLVKPAFDATAFLLIPLSLCIAILRYGLFDIDLIINRTLVYIGLTLSLVGFYVVIVGYLGLIFRTDNNRAIAMVGAALVAVLFQPLRERLQRGINRLMYGERDSPHAVLSRLGRRLEESLSPEATLPAIVETIADALNLPSVAIFINDAGQPRLAALHERRARIRRDIAAVRLPLVYQREVVGELVLTPRDAGEEFTRAERELLQDIAHQTATAVHATRLTTDLQHSRERLIAVREEERRRLRRDLHDGFGPRLASMGLQIAAVRNRLSGDPVVSAHLADLKLQIQDAVADVRRLVNGLRPPALDELGLLSAITEYGDRLSGNVSGGPPGGNRAMRITVESQESLPPLPAAVEVAAYRITLEALTNVARHASARTCIVRLLLTKPSGQDAPRQLAIEIIDDGCGLSPESRAGTGLRSMRERATELGGSCIVEPVSPRGTCVRAVLPLIGGAAEDV